MPNEPHPRLSEEEMQERFNRGRYWECMQAGEFTEEIIAYHPDTLYPEVISRHPGAVSVTAHYLDRNKRLVAEVHYFRMPDGSVIPGKRPDPKLLLEGDVLYHREKKKARE